MGVNNYNVIVSANLLLRNDGLPRSSQKTPDDTGIAVYFKWKEEDMVIACDTFDLPGCNLWAIAKTIEAMRGIDRWGCSELLNRAFTGFKALPENASESVGNVPWWEILEVSQSASKEVIEGSYKSLIKIHHPDKPNGTHEKFIALQEAYKQAVSQFQS